MATSTITCLGLLAGWVCSASALVMVGAANVGTLVAGAITLVLCGIVKFLAIIK